MRSCFKWRCDRGIISRPTQVFQCCFPDSRVGFTWHVSFVPLPRELTLSASLPNDAQQLSANGAGIAVINSDKRHLSRYNSGSSYNSPQVWRLRVAWALWRNPLIIRINVILAQWSRSECMMDICPCMGAKLISNQRNRILTTTQSKAAKKISTKIFVQLHIVDTTAHILPWLKMTPESVQNYRFVSYIFE